MKNLFRHRKVRYKGLAKNTAQLLGDVNEFTRELLAGYMYLSDHHNAVKGPP